MNFHHHALILEVISGLHAQGSWTGKTHVQKCVFLLQSSRWCASISGGKEASGIQNDSPFQFVLYRHGPYSFDLENAIEEMSGYDALRIEPMGGYGVSLWVSGNAGLVSRYGVLTHEEKQSVANICQFVQNSDVKTLERYATAVWIRTREGLKESACVAKRLNQIKPHVSVEEALSADQKVAPFFTA